jgi:hypothetical protein
MILPSGVNDATEWYILGIALLVIPEDEKRCPAVAAGAYKTGVRTGWSAFDCPT